MGAYAKNESCLMSHFGKITSLKRIVAHGILDNSHFNKELPTYKQAFDALMTLSLEDLRGLRLVITTSDGDENETE